MTDLEKLAALLKEFGAQRISEVDPSNFSALIEKVRERLAAPQ